MVTLCYPKFVEVVKILSATVRLPAAYDALCKELWPALSSSSYGTAIRADFLSLPSAGALDHGCGGRWSENVHILGPHILQPFSNLRRQQCSSPRFKDRREFPYYDQFARKASLAVCAGTSHIVDEVCIV